MTWTDWLIGCDWLEEYAGLSASTLAWALEAGRDGPSWLNRSTKMQAKYKCRMTYSMSRYNTLTHSYCRAGRLHTNYYQRRIKPATLLRSSGRRCCYYGG